MTDARVMASAEAVGLDGLQPACSIRSHCASLSIVRSARIAIARLPAPNVRAIPWHANVNPYTISSICQRALAWQAWHGYWRKTLMTGPFLSQKVSRLSTT